MGSRRGIGWEFGPIHDLLEEPPENLGERTHGICLETAGEVSDLICALAVAAAIARLSDGLILRQDEDGILLSYSFTEKSSTTTASRSGCSLRRWTCR